MNDPTLIQYLYSVVGRANEGHGCECVQKQILRYGECVGWKMHASLSRISEMDGLEPGSRMFGMVDGNGASDDTGQSFWDSGE